MYHYLIFFFPVLHSSGILVPLPGIEPGQPAMKAQCPNHWTTREFPVPLLKSTNSSYKFYLYLCDWLNIIYLSFLNATLTKGYIFVSPAFGTVPGA